MRATQQKKRGLHRLTNIRTYGKINLTGHTLATDIHDRARANARAFLSFSFVAIIWVSQYNVYCSLAYSIVSSYFVGASITQKRLIKYVVCGQDRRCEMLFHIRYFVIIYIC